MGILLREPDRRKAPLVDQPLVEGRGGRPPRSPRQLDRVYRLPHPTRSLEDYLRLHHQDLGGLSGLDLDLEIGACAHRLRYEPTPRHRAWLMERVDRLRAERAKWDPDLCYVGQRTPRPDPFPQPAPPNGGGVRKSGPQQTETVSTVVPIRSSGRGR